MDELSGKKVVIVIDTGYHEHEFYYPYYRFLEAGADVVVAGKAVGTVYGEGNHGKDGLRAEVDCSVEDASGMDYDAVFIPGGIYGPLALRDHEPTLELVKQAVSKEKIVGAICHGPWVLVSAGVVSGRRICCPRDMSADVINAGGLYVNEEKAVKDGPLVTAVYFGYLPEMLRILLPAIGKG